MISKRAPPLGIIFLLFPPGDAVLKKEYARLFCTILYMEFVSYFEFYVIGLKDVSYNIYHKGLKRSVGNFLFLVFFVNLMTLFI